MESLAAVVVSPLDDVMASEVVAIPTRGIERWLTQRLSARLGASPGRADGVCANIDFPFPGSLVGGAVAAASGVDARSDPWLAERAVWPLLEVVDACLAEPWMASLHTHLGGIEADPQDARRTRRFATVRHLADLYDRYGVHRPDMLLSWAAGRDVDGSERPLGGDIAWQAELWRRLRDRIASPSPAERLEDACTLLRTSEVTVELPQRLSLFGLTRLPVSYLDVLEALSVRRDVHLFLLHPSPVLWDRVADTMVGEGPRSVRRIEDHTADLPRHPLLASWGRDAREMQLLLTRTDRPVVDGHRGVTEPGSTLLARLQADVRADRPPAGLPLPGHADVRPLLEPADRSVQVHACHGRARQVEVMRDAILHLLTDDPSLEARDVIVMCPDIETFAPLILATFGTGDATEDASADEPSDDPAAASSPIWPELRVRLADRSLRQTNPVLAVVSDLLKLADARLTASQVLDLASRDPIRRRFRLDEDDLTRVQEWVASSGVRWGIDAAHREPFKLHSLDANTWRTGMDRVLLGAALAEDGKRLFGGVLPLDDVDSGDIDLAGRFAEFIDRLEVSLDGLRGPQPLDSWVLSIIAAADSLTATSVPDAWQRSQLQRLLDDIVTEATVVDSVSTASLALPEIRSLLANRLKGRPTRANFRTGHLTICTLVPMRSVPHRAVCLLGLDDGVFPRQSAPDGDDLIAGDVHVGDRDVRSEDHQLLLDAVLAATESLIVTYAGRDERTNAPNPPAVPVGELLDVIDATVRTADVADGADPLPARQQVVVHHPLQPFDIRNFTVGALVGETTWSFDHIALDGAKALLSDRTATPPFLPGPLPRTSTTLIELDDLVRFVQHPVRAFLRQRLGVTVSQRSSEVSDALPVEVVPLDRWGLGQRLLESRIGGASANDCLAAEIARGVLPPGELVHPVVDTVMATVDDIVAAALTLTSGTNPPTSIEVNLALDDGRSLVGTVPNVGGLLLRSVNYGRVSVRHRLAAWVRFLALTAARPETGFAAATIGRARTGAGKSASVTIARIPPFSETAGETSHDNDAHRRLALGHLRTLVDLYDRGMREPPPLYCATSAAYADAVATGNDPARAAANAWTSAYNYPKEDAEPEHRLVLGGVRAIGELLDARPRGDERGEGWASDEDSRVGCYALRLWNGLLSCEDTVDR